MKYYHLSYCALASMLLLASCQEDLKDEGQPTVSITSPTAGQKVWLDTPLKVDATDERGVSKVAFYMNEELIGEDTEAPYELMLDTKEYEDGNYTLRAIAYDDAENQTTAEQEIEIFNKLLAIEVEASYLEGARREWIVVSESKGKVLQTKEIKNSLASVFTRPEGFSDGQISVTFVRVFYKLGQNSYDGISINTYCNLSPDAWILRADTTGYSREEVIGNASIEFPSSSRFINTPDGYADLEPSYVNGSQGHYGLSLFRDPARLYIGASLNDGQPPRFKSLSDIRIGNHYTLTSRDFKPMTLMKTVDLPSVDFASAEVRGYYATERSKRYMAFESQLVKEEANKLSFYQPDSAFDSFEYTLISRKDNIGYFRRDNGTLPESYTIPTAIPAEVTSYDRANFKASITYECDYVCAVWYNFFDEDDGFRVAVWNVYGANQGEVQLAAPQLPSVITDAFFLLKEDIVDIAYSNIELVREDNIDSFEDLITQRFRNRSASPRKTFEKISVRPENAEGGRTANQNLSERVRRELERWQIVIP